MRHIINNLQQMRLLRRMLDEEMATDHLGFYSGGKQGEKLFKLCFFGGLSQVT